MHLLPKSMAARITHKIAADYRMKIPLIFNLITVIGILLIVAAGVWILTNQLTALSVTGIIIGIVLILPRAVFSSLLHKFQDIRYHVRDAMVMHVNWRGDEQVLDVGTGSGLTLFGCAEKLTSGKATGIDVFLEDSGGGTADIFWKNAKAEKVSDRVALEIADARDMPFDDNSFDVVVSSSAFHHMGGSDSRQKAAREIIRVLKPGGRVVMIFKQS